MTPVISVLSVRISRGPCKDVPHGPKIPPVVEVTGHRSIKRLSRLLFVKLRKNINLKLERLLLMRGGRRVRDGTVTY